MNARVARLEIWRSAKDVLDDERHKQNVQNFADLHELTANNGAKLDVLIKTAVQEGAVRKFLIWIAGLATAGGTLDFFWPKK